jgi:hypothetical protein
MIWYHIITFGTLLNGEVGLIRDFVKLLSREGVLLSGQQVEKIRKVKRTLPPDMIRAIAALIEMDIRYHDIGLDSGVFRILDRTGVLNHRIVTDDEITTAMNRPPTGTRAELRGKTIAELAASGKKARVSWSNITLPDDRRFLDMADPYACNGEWEEFPPPQSRPRTRPHDLRQSVLDLFPRSTQ